MVRLGLVASVALSLPAAAWGNPPALKSEPGPTRSFFLPQPSSDYPSGAAERFGRARIAPNAHFGVGLFGLKPEKSPLRPVTVREIQAPKQRRAAVGFSLQF